MAASARVLLGRVAEKALNKTMTGNYTEKPFTRSATNKTMGGGTKAKIIASLVFAESKSVRTSTIILASFNMLAAFAMAVGILYNCYLLSRRCNPKYKALKFCISSIHPAETFPLILAIGIIIQGLVFAGVSGEGLKSLNTSGCSVIAQFMWPALFIVPYLQLVFGLECALRSLRNLPFQARGKYNVAICCTVVVLMLFGTWLPSHLMPQPDICFASLVWFITRYGQLGLTLLSITAALMTISAIIIFVRLSTVNMIDEHQRIAASRMVYYLVLGIVPLAFVIPFFGSLLKGPGENKLAMMATVVLNLSGLMSGFLQLFLRSNTAAVAFDSKRGSQWNCKQHLVQIFGPNELAMQNHLVDPVTGPGTKRERSSRATSRESLVGSEKGRIISMESLDGPTNPFSPKRFDEISELPSMQELTDASKPSMMQGPKPSYSLFPVEDSSPIKATQQPISVYDISHLAPPPVIHYKGGSRHRRDSSIASSATVQIGLRISHAPLPSEEDINALPLPASIYKSGPDTAPTKPQTSTLPSKAYTAPPLPSSTYSATKPFAAPATRPTPPSSPLKVQTNISSPRIPTSLNTVITRSPEGSPTRPFVNKELPPTPKELLPKLDIVQAPAGESMTQLTPAVYSPEKKIKTTGLGKVVGGPMSATLPQSNSLRGNPLGSPLSPPKRSNSDHDRIQTKADWI